MKLITLNVWGGRIHKPLSEFLKKNSSDIDIFCFQEVFRNGNPEKAKIVTDEMTQDFKLFENMSSLLPNHKGYFCPVLEDHYGLAIFVHKDIDVLDEGNSIIYEAPTPFKSWADKVDHTRKLQWIKCRTKNGKEYVVMNIHGHWAGQSKSDTVDRIEQSKRILVLSEKFDGSQVICGDFNLRPDTKSIHMLDEKFRNLITENKVISTRTNLHKRSEKYADFIFTSPNIKIDGFKVLPDEVSDHCALKVEFN